MEKIKLAINGFGRIGRLAFRLMSKDENYEIVAINNRTSNPKMLAHLLKYDTAQGRFDSEITYDSDSMYVDGKRIRLLGESDATKLPWGQMDIDVVLECTGSYATFEKAREHITAGAKRVVLSAPSKDSMPTIVYNVNHTSLKKEDIIISAASCTTNCLAPMAKALDDLCSIESGLMTTIHAYTGDQNVLDGTHKGDLRRARAAGANIVPNTTGAAKAIGLVIPSLKGKLDGSAQRVPTVTGSLTELTAVVSKSKTAEEINSFMKTKTNESYGYNDEEIVSSDIIGCSYGSLFDATLTKVMPLENGKALVKVSAWYDNELGYTHQMVRTIKYFCSLK